MFKELPEKIWEERKKIIEENPLLSRTDVNKRYKFNIYKLFERYPELHSFWKKYEKDRRHIKMKGNRNGKRPPSVLIPKDELVSLLNKGYTKEEIQKKYSISERLFIRNLEEHNLENLWLIRKNSFLKQEEDILLANELECFNKDITKALNRLSSLTDLERLKIIRKTQREIKLALIMLSEIGKKIRLRVGSNTGISLTLNSGEIYTEIILEELGEEYKAQYRVDNFVYDFYLEKRNLILEINGDIHKRRKEIKEKDVNKIQKAKELGYNIEVISCFTRKTLYKLDTEVKNAVYKYPLL